MTRRRSAIRIAISGHQSRPGLDWDWIASEIRKIFEQNVPVERAFTSLAIGSDQVFAHEALALGVPVTAVIPLPNYERFFKNDDLTAYKSLLARCDVEELSGGGSDEQSFLEAGRRVADNSDLLVAVWDGKPAAGLGGTADIVRYCNETGRSVVHINPMTRTIQVLESNAKDR